MAKTLVERSDLSFSLQNLCQFFTYGGWSFTIPNYAVEFHASLRMLVRQLKPASLSTWPEGQGKQGRRKGKGMAELALATGRRFKTVLGGTRLNRQRFR